MIKLLSSASFLMRGSEEKQPLLIVVGDTGDKM